MNEMLLRAMDTLFPNSVFGGQEYNINKTIVAQNNVFAPVLNADWKKCMSGEVGCHLARVSYRKWRQAICQVAA